MTAATEARRLGLDQKYPDARDWTYVGTDRRLKAREGSIFWRYVLLAEDRSSYVALKVDHDMGVFAPGFVFDRLERHLQRELELAKLPTCVVPECGQKAPTHFTALEHGKLAGREWARDDVIDLCVPHGIDVYRAQGVYGVDRLAEWLRPDAKLDPLDDYDSNADSISGREIRRERGRALLVRQADVTEPADRASSST